MSQAAVSHPSLARLRTGHARGSFRSDCARRRGTMRAGGSMPIFRRSDGDLVRDLPLVRRIMPYLMRGRNESVVYHDATYATADARVWLDAFNAARPGEPPATLFHLFLFGCARTLHERPGLNRFVSGGNV